MIMYMVDWNYKRNVYSGVIFNEDNLSIQYMRGIVYGRGDVFRGAKLHRQQQPRQYHQQR